MSTEKHSRPLRLEYVEAGTLLFMADDDITALYALVGLHHRKITDPVAIRDVVDNAAQCCIDAKLSVFGFSVTKNPLHGKPTDPFELRMWTGSAWGVVGRPCAFDANLRRTDDLDFCLQVLCRDRALWVDRRFHFAHGLFENAGGTAAHRGLEQIKDELAYLKRKWCRHITVKWLKSRWRISLHVK